MNRQIIKTKDGSTTIMIEQWGETYHSQNGAIAESKHVFIDKGLKLFENRELRILEIGFGTGLNAFMTYVEAEKLNQKIWYETTEAYPIEWQQARQMNYVEILKEEKNEKVFEKMHVAEWGIEIKISPEFIFKKRLQRFEEIDDQDSFDLIYFDAFGAKVQPQLWEKQIFSKMYQALKKEGVLVTYSCKGSVRRAMKELGFEVERLEGAVGKREMLRARKI